MNTGKNYEKILNEAKRPKNYNSYTLKDIYIPMRDGKRLFAKAAFPDGEFKKLPVVLQRTPYGIESLRYFFELSLFGYIAIAEECRGTGRSEGDWEPFMNERSDGLDTVKFIEAQEWFDGNLGMTGQSYGGACQWFLAKDTPPSIKAFDIEVFNPYRHSLQYTKGNFRLEAYTGWTVFNSKSGSLPAPPKELYEKALSHTPQITMDEEVLNSDLPWYRKWVTTPDYSDEYWHSYPWGFLEKMPDIIKTPVCLRAGQYDPHFDGMIKSYFAMPESTREKSLLIISPFNHKAGISSDVDLPGAYSLCGTRFFKSRLLWFDHMLKGYPADTEITPGNVCAYILGENRWQVFKGFPENGKTLCLKADFKSGGLTENAVNAKPVAYVYDPESPVPTCGSEVIMMKYLYFRDEESAQGRRFIPPVGERDDVISFVSSEFDEDFKLFGNIKVRMLVSSTAKDTAFTAKLSEVLPDGRALHIRDSICSLKFREGEGKSLSYAPDEKVWVNIDLWPILLTVKKGSALRLDITSSNFPAFNPHANTDKLWSKEDKPIKAVQTIYEAEITLNNKFTNDTNIDIIF